MAKKQEKEIERWVTVNGARVPIFKDGSVGGPKALRDKVKAVVKEKSSDGKPLKDMSATDIGKEYLTATGERKKALLKELHNRGYRRNKDGSWGKQKDESKKDANKEAKSKAFKEAAANYKAHKEGKKPIPSSFDDMTSQEREQWRKDTKKAAEVDNITGKNVKWLDYNIKQQGLGMESADMEDIKRDAKFMNGEKVSLYDKAGNEYRGTFNVYNDGGMEVVDIKKEWHNRKPDDTSSTGVKNDRPKTSKTINDNEDLKEKQIAKNETVEQAMDRLQKESRAKVDSMSAQQVMKYAKENGLRGLKTDTLAQRDDRVANHMYMQEMKKWREQKNVAENEALKEKQIAQNKVQRDERNNQVSDRVKSYQDKFLKKKSVEEIKEIQSNIEKAGTHLGYTDSDMVAMRAIENELKERKASKGVKGTNSKEDRVKKTFGTTAAEARKSLKEYDNIDLKEVALECGFDRKLVDHLTSQELRAAILAIYKRK